jgi:hypothetical protein
MLSDVVLLFLLCLSDDLLGEEDTGFDDDVDVFLYGTLGRISKGSGSKA